MHHSPSSFRHAMRKVVVLASATVWVSISAAADIHVPADQPTIQKGIKAAKEGDRVLVAPGTYVENIDFAGKRIEVLSTGGSAVTTIDGSGKGSVVRIVEKFAGAQARRARGATLSGFRLQNGLADQYGGDGIFISNASPTISDNEIADNLGNGGGVYAVHYSAARIVRNHIHHSTGGGVYADYPEGMVIEGNLIEENFGGGIDLVQNNGAFADGVMDQPGARATVSRNVIRNNISDSKGGISSTLTRLRLLGNVIVSNGSYGVVIHDGHIPWSSIHVVNNTVAGHSDVDVLIDVIEGHLAVVNNIVNSHASPWAVACELGKGHKANISHNLVRNTGGDRFKGNCNFSDGGLILDDPRFVGGDGDDAYWLTSTSPAIDVGDNEAARRLKSDAAGNVRIVNGTVDLGAYEFVGQ